MDKINNNVEKNESSIKILKYAAAALSIVSFITTLNGVSGIVVDNDLLAGLISFAVQAVILALGLNFLGICQKITGFCTKKEDSFFNHQNKHIDEKPSLKKKRDLSKLFSRITNVITKSIKFFFKSLLIIIILTLYLANVIFSSTFSYVYMANSAYSEVELSDYNTEIEQFLVDNARKLTNINSAVSNELKVKIQQLTPAFQNIIQENITSTDETIRNSIIEFKSDSVVALTNYDKAFNTTYRNTIDETNLTEIEQNSLNIFSDIITSRENEYIALYNEYAIIYNTLDAENIPDIDTVTATYTKLTDINNEITTLRAAITKSTTGLPNSFINIASNAASQLSSDTSSLTNKVKALRSFYGTIRDTIENERDSLSLDDFNMIVYSDDIGEKINDAMNELNGIIAYILDTKSKDGNYSDNDSLNAMTACMQYLSELKKAKEVGSALDTFITSQLDSAYIIQPPETSGTPTNDTTDETETEETDNETESETTTDTTETNVNEISGNITETDLIETEPAESETNEMFAQKVTKDEWNDIRRRNMAEFIGIIKSMPSLQILGENNPYGSEEDISNMLAEAYSLNRNKLESIGELEKAKNYLCSDYNFLAVSCVILAPFLDLSSLMIGFIITSLHYKRKNDALNAEESTNENPIPSESIPKNN